MASQPPDRNAGDSWTVGRIIDWTTAHLRKHGSDSPRLEAEILLAHVRRCPRIQLYVQYNELLTDNQRAAMRDLVRRRAQAEPVAYLVGHREFFGLEFHVNSDVLVPRPETERLALEVITAAKSKARPRILDVGTGSGCIAIAVAVNVAAALVSAIDISPKALALAGENAARHGVADRVRFFEGDLFGPLPAGEQFDVIVSNPPYVADDEIETLPADIRLHEPPLALRAGPAGLNVIARLPAGAQIHLVAGGMLLFEISPEQAAAACALVEQTSAFDGVRLVKDAAGKERIVAARRRAVSGAVSPG